MGRPSRVVQFHAWCHRRPRASASTCASTCTRAVPGNTGDDRRIPWRNRCRRWWLPWGCSDAQRRLPRCCGYTWRGRCRTRRSSVPGGWWWWWRCGSRRWWRWRWCGWWCSWCRCWRSWSERRPFHEGGGGGDTGECGAPAPVVPAPRTHWLVLAAAASSWTLCRCRILKSRPAILARRSLAFLAGTTTAGAAATACARTAPRRIALCRRPPGA